MRQNMRNCAGATEGGDGKMKVIVKKEFRDRKCGLVLRRIGEKFGATKERAEELEKL